MKFNELNSEDQALLNTQFPEEIEKVAAGEVALAQEMYTTGFDKLAVDTADALDKLATEKDDHKKHPHPEEERMDEETEKHAEELSAFVERGYFDGLRKLGAERHDNEWHYLEPFLEEKIAQVKEAKGLVEHVSGAGKAMAHRGYNMMHDLPKGMNAIEASRKGILNANKSKPGAVQEYAGKMLHTLGKTVAQHPRKSMAAAGAGTAAAGYGTYRALKKKDKKD